MLASLDYWHGPTSFMTLCFSKTNSGIVSFLPFNSMDGILNLKFFGAKELGLFE